MHLGLMYTDSQLIERVLQGDSSAFDSLAERHKNRIYSLVYRMVVDKDWAEDITVETFLEAYQSLSSFKNQAKFDTWLHRIAVNVCLENIRRKRGKKHLEEVPLDGNESDSAACPLEIAMNNHMAERVNGALQTLPETYRAAVALFYLEERSMSEISEILSIPKGTVKTRIFHATRVLRDKLRAEGIIPLPKGAASGV